MLLGWLEWLLLTVILYVFSWLPETPHPRQWYVVLFSYWCRAWVHALGVELFLHQRNKKDLPKQFLLVANHPSAFEDIGIPALFNVHSLAKIEVKSWWIVGRISAAAGTLFVQRESKTSRANASQQIAQRLKMGENVALYPEGGVKGKRLHSDFRYGVFDISLKTNIPILPVYLHYESLDDFYWGNEHLMQKIIHFMFTKNNRVNYYVYDAFDPNDFDDKVSYCNAVYAKFKHWEEHHLG